MQVFEHCEACPAPFGGGTLTRSMRRVANATLLRFDRYDEPASELACVHESVHPVVLLRSAVRRCVHFEQPLHAQYSGVVWT